MYKRAVGLLVLGSVVFMACFLCVRGVDMTRLNSGPASELRLGLGQVEAKDAARRGMPQETAAQEMARAVWAPAAGGMDGEVPIDGKIPMEEGSFLGGDISMEMGVADVTVSGQRVVDYSLIDPKYVYHLTEEEREVLCRIVEAEAGSEDEDGRLLVANVVLNRVNSDKFPDTVTEVVFQRERGVSQFSPAYSGRYDRVTVSEKTAAAVERALMGEDISQGALYFAARKYADSDKMSWFDTKLTYLFLYGGHEFYK